MLKEVFKNADSKDLLPLAMAIHILVNKLPVTVRSKEKQGVRLERVKLLMTIMRGMC